MHQSEFSFFIVTLFSYWGLEQDKQHLLTNTQPTKLLSLCFRNTVSKNVKTSYLFCKRRWVVAIIYIETFSVFSLSSHPLL